MRALALDSLKDGLVQVRMRGRAAGDLPLGGGRGLLALLEGTLGHCDGVGGCVDSWERDRVLPAARVEFGAGGSLVRGKILIDLSRSRGGCGYTSVPAN